MSDTTGIEWTDATWSPTVGCSVLSPGCTNCYAMKFAARLERMGGKGGAKYAGLTQSSKGGAVWNGTVRLDEGALLLPLRWKRPRRIFVNSMSDLFHKSLPAAAIDRVFAIMALAHWHTFQVLTKRDDRMRRYVGEDHKNSSLFERIASAGAQMVEDGDTAWSYLLGIDWPLPNVWLGVSVEDQARADERIPNLLATPAAVRFLSCEPLLGPVDIRQWLHPQHPTSGSLDWVIVGGESGPGARPMHPDWARAIRDQCAAAGVPFFFKQWGEWHGEAPLDGSPTTFLQDRIFVRLGKRRAGRLLDGREHDEFPMARPA